VSECVGVHKRVPGKCRFRVGGGKTAGGGNSTSENGVFEGVNVRVRTW
jgi:hypothetical protein